MLKFVLRMALAACCFVGPAALAPSSPAAAQDAGAQPDTPGQFDFYVLSLSWSPSFCAAAADRNAGRAVEQQCGARPFSFVVHGLWPQYDKGFPENCRVPAPRLDRRIVDAMLDLMPAPRLIFNEWDKHGTCSGLSPRAYFATVRKARAAVQIPPSYTDLKAPLAVSPGAVADAFMAANPGLPQNAIAIMCDNKRLTEVRICLARDLQFHQCPDVARRSCRRDRLIMPPLRGG